MRMLYLVPLMISACLPASPEPLCLGDASLKELDAGWERAYLERDADFLEGLLAEDFIWVHTHASGVDSKADVLLRVTTSEAWDLLSRVQSEVAVRRLENTGVVTGYTVVSRPSGSTRYTFMRTYVASAGQCVLLANQTMAIPESE